MLSKSQNGNKRQNKSNQVVGIHQLDKVIFLIQYFLLDDPSNSVRKSSRWDQPGA